MDKQKKTLFLLYPFIGLYSIFRWFGIGIGFSIQMIITIIYNIFLYAFLGIKYTITFPFKLLNKNKLEENKDIPEPTKAEKINEIMANLQQRETIAQNEKELPMLNTNASTISEDIAKEVYTVTAKNKRKIMKAKQKQYRQAQKNEKNRLKMSRRQSAKLMAEKQALQDALTSGNIQRTNKPVAFRYKAIDPTGKMVSGTFTGSSKLDVNAFLVNEGYDVYSIKTSGLINFLYGQSSFGVKKMSNKDLIFWLTQLHTYVKAGIPLTDAVKILSNQMGKSGSRKRIFEKIIYELTMGSSFSSALEKQGEIFPNLLINMLRAAEATGELEETLKDMADYYSETESTRKQMVSAMTYPAIITVFATAVISFIMLYVIPQFTKVYEQAGVEINGLTASIISVSDYLKTNFSTILFIVVVIALLIFIAYKKIKFFRRNLQILLMHIPIFGKIIIYNEMTLFTKTFASLLKNNVLITESVEILSKVTNNEIYKEIMYSTISNIARGEKISESFKDHWAIPDIAYYMIVTGESTGELATMMGNVSVYYQEQHRSLVSNLKAFIEPIMIVSLALVVGVIIMAVIIPMFDLYSEISM